MFKFIYLTSAILIVFVGGCLAAASKDIYAQATEFYSGYINLSYFGMHFHRLVLHPNEKNELTKWPDAPIGSLRLWDAGVRWADIVPFAGQWNFGRMDSYVEQAVNHKSSILYVLGSTPRWVSARPSEQCPYGMGCAAEPVRMAHWEEYVRRVASRYKGKIFAYELWNEPFFSDLKNQKGSSDFYYGPVSKMVEMAKVARRVLDEVDPNAILATPGFTGPTNQLELFLNSGGRQYVQAVAFHFYATNTEQFVRQLLEVRAIMKRQGIEKLPLWNTETGLEVHDSEQFVLPGVQKWSREEAASKMAQFFVIGAAAGLEHYYYYAWDNGKSGMISPSGAVYPARDAYEKVQSWLLDARMNGCESIPGNGLQCLGEQNGQQFMIVWADKKSSYEIPILQRRHITSIEKLFDTSPQAVTSLGHISRITLGDEPVRILYE